MTHFRPPPPKPKRLNHVALLLAGAVLLLTVIAVLWWATSCTRARSQDSAADAASPGTVAPRTVPPQHPSYPISYRIDSLSSPAPHEPPPPIPAASLPSVATPPPRAWRSALLVPVGHADSTAPVAVAPVPVVPASPYVLLSG